MMAKKPNTIFVVGSPAEVSRNGFIFATETIRYMSKRSSRYSGELEMIKDCEKYLTRKCPTLHKSGKLESLLSAVESNKTVFLVNERLPYVNYADYLAMYIRNITNMSFYHIFVNLFGQEYNLEKVVKMLHQQYTTTDVEVVLTKRDFVFRDTFKKAGFTVKFVAQFSNAVQYTSMGSGLVVSGKCGIESSAVHSKCIDYDIYLQYV